MSLVSCLLLVVTYRYIYIFTVCLRALAAQAWALTSCLLPIVTYRYAVSARSRRRRGRPRQIQPLGRARSLTHRYISLLSAGVGSGARFNTPSGVLVISFNGRALCLIADSLNHRIRALDLTSMLVFTLAGRGTTGASN